MESIIVVGAGVSGLAAAAELGRAFAVTVVDRLPAVGGARHYDDPDVAGLEERCRALGVSFELGTTALRWTGRELLVAAPGRIRWLTAERLVYAGGRRPSTSAEMRIAGGRLAGVVVATVAVHLLEAGVDFGRRPLIVGVSDWAERVAALLRARHLPVRVVTGSEVSRPAYADEFWAAWEPRKTDGIRRVQALMVERDGQSRRLLCDALILADAVRPLRNVEGAVLGGDNVTFVQSDALSLSAEAAWSHARVTVAHLLSPGARAPS